MIILLIYLSHFSIIFSHDETVKTANTECEVVQFYEIITLNREPKF
jgi:hypothetical protein